MSDASAFVAWLEASIAANALSAIVLALLAWGVGRWVRRPAVRHALWLVVLLDLLTPPIVRLELLPPVAAPTEMSAAVGTEAMGTDVMTTRTGVTGSSTGRQMAATSARVPTHSPAGHALPFGLLAVLGSSLLGLRAFYRARSFDRLIRGAAPAPAHLVARVARLAQPVGLARTPPVRLTQMPVPPLVWLHKGLRPTLLLPASLIDRLGEDELDAVLAHELAHVARLDPWVRLAELGATTLCWWHPALWWARSALRRAEEQACDARVVAAFPALAGAYARGLVETVAYLARHQSPTLSDATTADPRHDLEERLTMILRPTDARPLPRALRLLLCTVAVVVLFILPVRGSVPAASDERPDAGPSSEEEALTREEEAQRELETAYEQSSEQLERKLEQQQWQGEKLQIEATERIERLERALEKQQHELEMAYQRESEALERGLETHTRSLEKKFRQLEHEWTARAQDAACAKDGSADESALSTQHEQAERLSRMARERHEDLALLQTELQAEKRAEHKAAFRLLTEKRERERAAQQEALRDSLATHEEQIREQAEAMQAIVQARQQAAHQRIESEEIEAREMARRLERQAVEHAARVEQLRSKQAQVRQQLQDRIAAADEQLQEAQAASRGLDGAKAMKRAAEARRAADGMAGVRPMLRRHLAKLMDRLQALRERTSSEAEAHSIDEQLETLRAEIEAIEP